MDELLDALEFWRVCGGGVCGEVSEGLEERRRENFDLEGEWVGDGEEGWECEFPIFVVCDGVVWWWCCCKFFGDGDVNLVSVICI